MAAIDSLMKKLGFVKLSAFGLVLTPEGRLLSTRPAVLDDGFGGKIVGWRDGDLAAAELERWEPRGASTQAVASRVAAPRPPLPTHPVPVVRVARPVSAAPVAPIAREHVMQHVTPIIPITPPAAIVAPAPVVEEDDWEWTIAIARARAAAEEVEVSVAAVQAPPRRLRADTLPPPMITAKDPIASDNWDKTQPLGEIDYNDYTNPVAEVVRVVRAAAPVTTRVVGPTPSTVIPIPRLPTTANTSPRSSSMTPVVRQTLPTPILPESPRRFAKGTAPVLPQSTSRIKPPAAPPVPAMSDDTLPSLSLPSIKRLTQG